MNCTENETLNKKESADKILRTIDNVDRTIDETKKSLQECNAGLECIISEIVQMKGKEV